MENVLKNCPFALCWNVTDDAERYDAYRTFGVMHMPVWVIPEFCFVLWYTLELQPEEPMLSGTSLATAIAVTKGDHFDTFHNEK